VGLVEQQHNDAISKRNEQLDRKNINFGALAQENFYMYIKRVLVTSPFLNHKLKNSVESKTLAKSKKY
jgi:hypothetical protein